MTTQVERNSLWPNHLPSVQLKKGRTFNRHALPTLNISINIPRGNYLTSTFLPPMMFTPFCTRLRR